MAFLYRATPAVTRNLGFCGIITRTASFSRLLRQALKVIITSPIPLCPDDSFEVHVDANQVGLGAVQY